MVAAALHLAEDGGRGHVPPLCGIGACGMAEPSTAGTSGAEALAPEAPYISAAAGEKAPQECIQVIARVRPDAQPSANLTLRARQLDICIPRGGDGLGNNQIEEYNFKFSRVIGPTATQEDVFNSVARDLVLGALDGVNCSVFAYGQTGSGKTFTICGGKGAESYDNRGIIPRTLACIFDAIDRRQDDATFIISMSFIEVYKEVGYDLLSKDFGSNTAMWPVVTVSFVGEEPVLRGAKRVTIASEEEGLHQYYMGDTHRTVAETPHNLNSSRSHCLCTIFIEASDPESRTKRTSKIQIVDLAGSERLKPYEQGSQSDKVLMGQAVAINVSLFNLSLVIMALNQARNRGPVPYRNSFLTKVLKDALGGNAKAVMVATVNPSDAALPETISTCRFAQNVANVQTYARVNEAQDPELVIAGLRQENAELRAVVAASAGVGSDGAPVGDVPPEELRQRCKAFLEDDSGGVEGGASLDIGPLSNAFAAFRIFRELFWELLRRSRMSACPVGVRPGTGEAPDAAPEVDLRQKLPRPGSAEAGDRSVARTPRPRSSSKQPPLDGDAAAELRRVRATLDERDGECRMLRAALAAQPPSGATFKSAHSAPRAAARLRVVTVSAGTQTVKVPAKTPGRRKLERPSSADGRTRASRNFVGFSPEDVVDRFGRGAAAGFAESSVPHLPPLAAASRTLDPRVPDFRAVAAATCASPLSRSSPALSAATTGAEAAETSATAARSGPSPTPPQLPGSGAATAASKATAVPPQPPPRAGASSAWLNATTALTEQERQALATPAQAYQVFLAHDPRAAAIWPEELQGLRAQRKVRMEEAKTLGEDIEQTKEATRKVQGALEGLKLKLREAEEAAAVDPGAEQRAATLRQLLSSEEPRLAQVFDEKRQRYELDFGRLKELRRELSHFEHGEKRLETSIQTEFSCWLSAAKRRYEGVDSPAAPSSLSASAAPPAVASAGSAAFPTTAYTAAMSRSACASPVATSASPAFASSALGGSAVGGATRAGESSANTQGLALAKAEAALASLRDRLEDARRSGDEKRAQMLRQLLDMEEPRLERLRKEQLR